MGNYHNTQHSYHRVSDVDASTKTGTCAVCGPAAKVRHDRSRDRWRCCQSDSRKSRPMAAAARRQYHLKSKFGLSDAEYAAMLAEQGGVCAICGGECATGWRLAVDHCHQTGQIRGLLCGRCNRAIGQMEDDPELLGAAANYLRSRN